MMLKYVMKKEIIFNNIKYRLMGSGKYYLSQSTTNAGRKGAKGLHVAIYEHYHNVLVAKGMIVHHIDGNTHNNSIENLELTTPKKHCKIHNANGNLESLPRAIEASKAWHSSEEGIAHHKRISKKAWEMKEEKQVPCDHCNVIHGSLFPKERNFCSTKCQQRYYKENKINHVKKVCPFCGEDFWHYKSKRQETCGRSCSAKFRSLKQDRI